MNESFIDLEDITVSPEYLRGWRIFKMTAVAHGPKKPFKNLYSRQLRIVNAVVSWSQQVRSIDRNLFFSNLKLLILRQWWQLRMKSTAIKQRYRINCFSLCCTCLFYCWTRWVNWFTIDVNVSLLLKLYGYIPVCKRTIVFVFMF